MSGKTVFDYDEKEKLKWNQRSPLLSKQLARNNAAFKEYAHYWPAGRFVYILRKIFQDANMLGYPVNWDIYIDPTSEPKVLWPSIEKELQEYEHGELANKIDGEVNQRLTKYLTEYSKALITFEVYEEKVDHIPEVIDKWVEKQKTAWLKEQRKELSLIYELYLDTKIGYLGARGEKMIGEMVRDIVNYLSLSVNQREQKDKKSFTGDPELDKILFGLEEKDDNE